MSIPNYPHHLRPCKTVREAVDLLLDEGIALKNTAIIHYVDDRFHYCFGNPRPRSPFSYNFFSLEGRNVGTYVPDMHSFQFQSGPDGRGRIWGIQSPDLVETHIDITPRVKLCRICRERPATGSDDRCSARECVPF